MADNDKGPDNPSSDHKAMADYWAMIEAINGGAETMRAAGEKYLPKFDNEDIRDYGRRKRSAPFTNIYSDVSRTLASKPFGRELTLVQGSDQSMLDLCEDIDGHGNNLHVFGSTIFQYGLDKGIDWMLVDYTKAPVDPTKPRSIADEKIAGYRPYLVHISAERMIAVYSDIVNGEETFIHARIQEDIVEHTQFDEVIKTRVRVLNREKQADGSYGPATYEVFEKQTKGLMDEWVSIEGPSAISIGVIPLVPFMTGKRIGSTWQVRPPLRDIAFLQIEEYQQESNLKSVQQLTAYPMLVGEGVTGTQTDPNTGKAVPIRVPVGPGGVLFAPQDQSGKNGTWKFIEPAATSIKILQDHLTETQKNMRDLGMQPLTQANLTVITTANVSMKANSQIQAWALSLKDALEQAFTFIGLWMNNQIDVEVDIFTDFGVELGDDTDIENVLKANSFGILSDRTTLEELKRRSFLSENLDIDEEEKRLAIQNVGLHPEVAIDPVTGAYVKPTSRPKAVVQPTIPSDVPTPQSVN